MIGPENLSYRELMLADWSPVADRLEDRRLARLAALPDVDGHVVQGDTIEVLLKLSDEVDVLVVGTRARARSAGSSTAAPPGGWPPAHIAHCWCCHPGSVKQRPRQPRHLQILTCSQHPGPDGRVCATDLSIGLHVSVATRVQVNPQTGAG